MVQYLIRLDDLCPTNNLKKWERFFHLFDLYDIKPIIAVIPDNQDPKLNACGEFNPYYWPMVRHLQKKDYVIGMHGFEHRYQINNSGLFKVNNRSEFAGLPLYIQEQKVKAAVAIFKREGVKTPLFIAPAHTFDRNTLKALDKHSDVLIISDGLLRSPYIRFGFGWIPVQLSEAVAKNKDTWTFNYHPETCTDEAFERLEKFIAENHQHFVQLSTLSFKDYTFKDYIDEYYQVYLRLLKTTVKDYLNRFRSFKLVR
ncbi:DUF2334 domain-containing protein [Mucilaginibacter pocheonensis]|uniref:DUF2334 domain-containing protein n=1 Tax=Mucilaginibacter pocheonensis TaxID=398050 RepID=A0ABU1T5U4_9SPHI|nr:DUF2334 domain-containing protein [Mucilaginibacter pocheonensis]MDR6940215.1 hypothetical protein [Mucilaginibacter pocheonensis]